MSLDLASVLNNNYAVAIFALFITVYASLERVSLPPYVRNLFKNDVFRVVFLSLLLIYNFEKSPHVALFVALIFVLTLHYLNQQESRENFRV
jgi:hypothetical protein